MENEVDSSRISIIIVLILSLLVIIMDVLEISLSFENFRHMMKKVEPTVFEECFKYQILSQIIFTVFALFAGLSALLMSIGLLVNFRFFTNKLIDTFLYYNYIIFGPYLLAGCVFSIFNFSNVAYQCERDHKQLNYATLFTIIVCIVVSFLVTLSQSLYKTSLLMIDSIRNGPNGIKLIGKAFWTVVL